MPPALAIIGLRSCVSHLKQCPLSKKLKNILSYIPGLSILIYRIYILHLHNEKFLDPNVLLEFALIIFGLMILWSITYTFLDLGKKKSKKIGLILIILSLLLPYFIKNCFT